MKKIILLSLTVFIFIGCTKLKQIELKCPDSIKGSSIIEKEFIAVCPANCPEGMVWGTKSYTTDSSICLAGIHGGAITRSGGKFKLKIVPGQTEYIGSHKNGITSSSWGSYDSGFTVSSP